LAFSAHPQPATRRKTIRTRFSRQSRGAPLARAFKFPSFDGDPAFSGEVFSETPQRVALNQRRALRLTVFQGHRHGVAPLLSTALKSAREINASEQSRCPKVAACIKAFCPTSSVALSSRRRFMRTFLAELESRRGKSPALQSGLRCPRARLTASTFRQGRGVAFLQLRRPDFAYSQRWLAGTG